MSDSMRSLSSFGVAGLIKATGEVFYTNDLRARNVGRISDLISAQIRGTDADELKIRALLTYGTFQCYAIRGIPNHHDEAVSPASVEVGADSEYTAVAISFHWQRNVTPKWAGLDERVSAGSPGDEFEKVLEWMVRHSTQVIIRYELKERRVEIVTLLNRSDADLRDPLMIIAVDSVQAPLLEVSQYRELGDLNYSKLLRNPVTATAVTGVAEEPFSEIVVSGLTAEEQSENRVISGAPGADDETIRFKATANSLKDSEELQSLVKDYEKTIGSLRESLNELQGRLEDAESRASEKHFKSGDGGISDPTEIVGGEIPTENNEEWGLQFLKQVWPFAPKEAAETETDIEVSDPSAIPAEEKPTPLSGAEIEANRALQELQEIAKQKRSPKMDSTLSEIRDSVDDEKATRWIDSLSSELLQEKAKLNDLQKVLAKQIRQREMEFKAAERTIQQELKKATDLVRQKETAIENKNDQIAQLNLAVERAGTASNDKEHQQMKVKLDRAQRIAQMKEEESKALVVKTRDLENRLIIAQAKAQMGNDPQLQQKLQGMEKKVDEYKRINQRLMESMNLSKDKSNDKEVADLRRKLEQLDRQITDSKRNLDKSNFRVRELQESERKIQADLARAVEENRNLRKSQSRGSGESGGGQAA